MLYYPSIRPTESLEAKLNAKTKEGMTRNINFMLTDYYGPSMFNNTNPSISQVLAQASQLPNVFGALLLQLVH